MVRWEKGKTNARGLFFCDPYRIAKHRERKALRAVSVMSGLEALTP
jgi:hypothetical protein